MQPSLEGNPENLANKNKTRTLDGDNVTKRSAVSTASGLFGNGGKRGCVIRTSEAPGTPLVTPEFFEAVLDAFRRRHPPAIQEAYLLLVASGGKLQGIRAICGKLYFTFLEPDGNQLMVTA
ncbi:hypothetical protein [Paenibacillus nasutitermitis]|uniref:Uncharacterized protein n=1 Tax=Paenibacillus nasutitermitis TaxID=1652958 RepID=A0A917DP06_9BACL|nr:hypothetical protein [Paenibacillus nasutitermitis]GGD55463.1 hypothetical protein GCM10010911_11450 [Paenibacillus nasutitermitis]